MIILECYEFIIVSDIANSVLEIAMYVPPLKYINEFPLKYRKYLNNQWDRIIRWGGMSFKTLDWPFRGLDVETSIFIKFCELIFIMRYRKHIYIFYIKTTIHNVKSLGKWMSLSCVKNNLHG